MEIIYENLPESNDTINLIIESSLLKNNPNFKYNNITETTETKNKIVYNQKQYTFNSIYIDLEKEKFLEIISNNIKIKSNLTILFMLSNHNESKLNYNSEINNIFNKENIVKYNIKNIMYNYYSINLNENKNDIIIADKTLNEENNYIIEIPKDEKNESLLKIIIDYSDIKITSAIQILFIHNSYDIILPLFTLEQKENDFIILKEKFHNLLSLEKEFKEKINNLPSVNSDYLEIIRLYKNDVINYYGNFLKNIEILDKKEKSAKNYKSIVNDSIKEAKKVLNSINSEQFKEREKEIYLKYIKIYSDFINPNSEKNTENSALNSFNIEELKIIINKFNNLNEELIEMLENQNEKSKDTDNAKDKEIKELKNKVNQLEKKLKDEKTKTPEIKNKQNNKNQKYRSMSVDKLDSEKDNKNNRLSGVPIKLEEENRNLKKNIDELKETISKLKINNDNLFKTNEKLLKEKNILKNELIKEKNIYSSMQINNSIDNIINNEVNNSPTKSLNKNKFNISQTSKKMNKNKTSKEPLFNGHSLLLLKKIQDENKELAKRLKDFSSKNFQLELTIKGINSEDTYSNMKSRMSSTSMMSNFTNNTRNELKNIEKKYILGKK